MIGRVSILSIGDEILIGQINNTNAQWLASKMTDLGFKVIEIHSIADSDEAILEAIGRANSISDLVLVTGGLGPTKDDITKASICKYFESELVMNQPVLDHVRMFFEKRGRQMTETNEKQALVPHNCEVVFNHQGTAPGLHLIKDSTHFLFMPGVPFEMKHLMESWGFNYFSENISHETNFKKTVLTHGVGESFLAELIKDWEESLPSDVKLAYLPSPGVVRLRLSRMSTDITQSELMVNQLFNRLEDIIPGLIFGEGEETMEIAVSKLLLSKSKTISTAESCTGGSVASMITSIPGSSKYFKGSVVAYSNEVKINILGVDSLLIDNHGAVSREVVESMALNACRNFNTDYALAVSGIAGPDGGTESKPVGTVWIALASGYGVESKKFLFGDNRERNIKLSSIAALNMLRLALIKS